MSRILRRPMFRGGPVDSRGTGITTGLDQPRIGARNGRFFGDTGNPFVPKPVTTQGIIDAYKPRGLPQSIIDFFKANQANQRSSGRFRTTTPGSTIEEAEGLFADASGSSGDTVMERARAEVLANASDPFVPDETPGFDGSAYTFFTMGDEIREEDPKLGVGSDYDKDVNERYLGGDPERDTGLEALRKGNIRDVGKTTIEDLTTTEEMKTPKPGDDDEPEVTMTDLEKALGLDRARQEYAADALAAASKAFFEGRGFEAISDAAQVKSKAPDIKRLAALEEFKADRREKLFDKKQDSLLKQRQGTKGAFQKKLDTITKQPEGTQGHKIALIENKLQPTIQGQIASETVDNNYTRPAPAVIIGYMDLYYPQSYAGTVAGDAEMAGKKAGTYITEDATTIIFWDGENARTQSI